MADLSLKTVAAGAVAAASLVGCDRAPDSKQSTDLSPEPDNAIKIVEPSWGFEDSLREMLGREGGLNTDARDRGNRNGSATNFGVTQPVYNEYRELKKQEPRDVREITPEEINGLYRELYWNRAHCDQIADPGIRLLVFDTAVNSGPSRAIQLLQESLGGLAQDGAWGPKTQAAVEGIVDPETVRENYLNARERFYRRIVENDPRQEVFIRGWINRVNHFRDLMPTIPIHREGFIQVPMDEALEAPEMPPREAAFTEYTVASGDSLWKIAKDQLGEPTRWPEIAELNEIDPENPAIREGQVLKIPRE